MAFPIVPAVVAVGRIAVQYGPRIVPALLRLDQKAEKIIKPAVMSSGIVSRVTRPPRDVLFPSQVTSIQNFVGNTYNRIRGRAPLEAPYRLGALGRVVGPVIRPVYEPVARTVRFVARPVVEPVRIGVELVKGYIAAVRAGFGPVITPVRYLVDPSLNLVYLGIRGVSVGRQLLGGAAPGLTERVLITGYRGYFAFKAIERVDTLSARLRDEVYQRVRRITLGTLPTERIEVPVSVPVTVVERVPVIEPIQIRGRRPVP